VDAFLWEPGPQGNEAHLTRPRPGRRALTRAEVDAMYAAGAYTRRPRDHWYPDGTFELQALLIGYTPAGRLLAVACQVADVGGVERLRPVTGWDATVAERQEYEDDHRTA
jgi:hypothetical protein